MPGYYNSKFGIFNSVDAHSDRYPGISNYAYCSNNPMNRIDPDGKDDWEVNKRGNVKWIKESTIHTLFSLDKNGKRDGNSLTLKDRKVFDDLSKSSPVNQKDAVGTVTREGSRRQAITDNAGKNDLLEAFKFMADNTDVEWRFSSANVNGVDKNALSTYGWNDLSPWNFKDPDITLSIHSHPRPKNDIQSEQESMYGDRGLKTPYTNHVYMKNSHRLYGVKSGKSPYIKTINSSKDFLKLRK